MFIFKETFCWFISTVQLAKDTKELKRKRFAVKEFQNLLQLLAVVFVYRVSVSWKWDIGAFTRTAVMMW